MEKKYPRDVRNFKLKIVADSPKAKSLAARIEKYINEWKYVSEDGEILFLDISKCDNITTYIGGFVSSYTCFDNTDILTLGEEIGELRNGSYLSIFVLFENFHHYVFGTIQKHIEEGGNINEEYGVAFYLYFSIAADVNLLNDVRKSNRINYTDESERYACERLIKEGIINNHWERSDFRKYFFMDNVPGYRGRFEDVYDKEFGVIGFKICFLASETIGSKEIERIISVIKKANMDLNASRKASGFRFNLTFDGARGFTHIWNCDKRCYEDIECDNNLYFCATNEHKMLKIVATDISGKYEKITYL